MPDAQKKVRGRVNLPLLARMLGRLDAGGHLRVQQVTNGFLAVGRIGEAGVYPADRPRRQPEQETDEVFRNAGSRIRARMSDRFLSMRVASCWQ